MPKMCLVSFLSVSKFAPAPVMSHEYRLSDLNRTLFTKWFDHTVAEHQTQIPV